MGTAARESVLGVFAKRPRPGDVKSRLAAATSAEWAARVALAFLRDTAARLARVPARRVLAFSPPDAEGFFRELAGGRFDVRPQAEGDLGKRMAAFVGEQLEAGATRVVLVGTDSPTLPVALVEQAFRALDGADVVIGPATDGGYYLIGCARQTPPVFDGITWGGPEVLRETVRRLEAAFRTLALLPPWYDVDTLDDWRALRGHVAALRGAGHDPAVPHTEALLAEEIPVAAADP